MYWNWALQASTSVFLVQFGNISKSNRVLLNDKLNFFLLGAQANNFNKLLIHWLANEQLQSNSIWHFTYFIFFPLINMPTFLAVVLWQIRTETLEAWGANSHFPVPCHPYLGASGQLYQVFNCPLLADRDQTQQNRILKLE